MKNLEDSVFGAMTLNEDRWEKEISFVFFKKSYTINCMVEDLDEEGVTDIQRDSYQKYIDNRTEMEDLVASELEKYVKSEDFIDIYEDDICGDGCMPVENHATPTSILFRGDGRVGVIFKSNWDVEDGAAVIIMPESEISVGNEQIII